MHLLAINQFFWPDVAPTGEYLLDLASAIEQDHNQVTAICGASDYSLADTTGRPRVEILRFTWIRFSRRALGRILSYAGFLASTFVNGFRVRRPDVVITLTTPPLLSVYGRILKLARGCRHFIWEMDVYPDIAVDLGYLRAGSFVTTVAGVLADWSRRNADGIIVLGEDMKARLISRGIPEHKITVVENWADGREITPLPFSDGPFTVSYNGNLGLAHETTTICAAMRHFRGDPRFRFIFAGGGARRKQVETFCRAHSITNAEFMPYCPRAELNARLAQGHVGLITQLSETRGSIVPSKTYGIMAAGRPILYIGPRDSTPARIIARHDCGWQIEPGAVTELIATLEGLELNRGLVAEAGRRSRQAFEANYDRAQSVARLERILNLTGPAEQPAPAALPLEQV